MLGSIITWKYQEMGSMWYIIKLKIYQKILKRKYFEWNKNYKIEKKFMQSNNYYKLNK